MRLKKCPVIKELKNAVVQKKLDFILQADFQWGHYHLRERKYDYVILAPRQTQNLRDFEKCNKMMTFGRPSP